jgi:hypothetical protein
MNIFGLISGVTDAISGTVTGVQNFDSDSGITGILKGLQGIMSPIAKGMSVVNGYNTSNDATKTLDNSDVFRSQAQAASMAATNIGADLMLTAAYNEADLQDYNSNLTKLEAKIIATQGELAMVQQRRVDKIASGNRTVQANSSGLYTAGTPTQALLTREDSVAEYNRAVMAYEVNNQVMAKMQKAEGQSYQADLTRYLGERQADAARTSAWYKMLASWNDMAAQKTARQVELEQYAALKKPLDSATPMQAFTAPSKPSTPFSFLDGVDPMDGMRNAGVLIEPDEATYAEPKTTLR